MKKQINFFSSEMEKTWLGRTKQLFKIRISLYSALILGFFLIIFFWAKSEPPPEILLKLSINPLYFSIPILICAIIALYSLFFWIKCPSCKKRIGGKIISNVSHSDFINVFFTFEKCPYCEYDGNKYNEDKRLSFFTKSEPKPKKK